MQPISLKKRLLYYVFLFVISLCGLFLAAFSGGREYGDNYLVICVFLIPQYIFGLVFLQTKLIIRLIVPFVTVVVSYGAMNLMGKIGFWDIDSEILFYLVLFLPVIFIWEIAYRILIKYLNQNKESNDIE